MSGYKAHNWTFIITHFQWVKMVKALYIHISVSKTLKIQKMYPSPYHPTYKQRYNLVVGCGFFFLSPVRTGLCMHSGVIGRVFRMCCCLVNLHNQWKVWMLPGLFGLIAKNLWMSEEPSRSCIQKAIWRSQSSPHQWSALLWTLTTESDWSTLLRMVNKCVWRFTWRRNDGGSTFLIFFFRFPVQQNKCQLSGNILAMNHNAKNTR